MQEIKAKAREGLRGKKNGAARNLMTEEKFQHGSTIKGITKIKNRRSEPETTDSAGRENRKRDGRWEKNIG